MEPASRGVGVEVESCGEGVRSSAALPIVPYVRFRCPECDAPNPRTYGQRGRTRYHLCRGCGLKFLSREVEPSAVRGF